MEQIQVHKWNGLYTHFKNQKELLKERQWTNPVEEDWPSQSPGQQKITWKRTVIKEAEAMRKFWEV